MNASANRHPADPARTAISRALDDMRVQFCAGLGARICRIEAARIALDADPAAALETVGFEAHRICGVAGSLGLHDLSTQARALEEHVTTAAGQDLSQSERTGLNERIELFLDLMEYHLTEN
ncbi:Hpt domain-containing protein [Roseovarius sp.]|uniref:Hpt domain-containing protein n=1 Tax=Roseovarius sp. TaxID=1486281 RepID=UPI003B5B0863